MLTATRIGARVAGREAAHAVRSLRVTSSASVVQRGAWQRGMSTRGEEIADKGKAAGVEFFQFSFVDLFGVQRSKLVPADRVKGMVSLSPHLTDHPTSPEQPKPQSSVDAASNTRCCPEVLMRDIES